MAIGQVNKQYVSSTAFLDQREILNKVLNVTNEETSFVDVMEMMNRYVPTKVPSFHHFINEELYSSVTSVGALTALTGANNVVGADRVVEMTKTDAATLRQGDMLMNASGQQLLIVGQADGTLGDENASTATNLDVECVQISLSFAVGAAAELYVFSNAAGEGSDSPAAVKYGLTKKAGNVQIFKNKYEITDIQKTSKVEVEYGGQQYYMLKGQHEALQRFRHDISKALMFGKGTGDNFSSANPTLTDANGLPVSTTKGLHWHIADDGLSGLTSGTANALDASDWAGFSKQFARERFGQDYILFCGVKGKIAIDNFIKGLPSSAAHAGVRFSHGAKDFDMNVDKFSMYGRNFTVVYLPLLDHKVTVGNIAAFNDSIYIVPADKAKVDHGGDLIDRIRVRYMTGDGTDLKYREILTGGLAPTPTNGKSVLEVHYQCVEGLEVLGASKFGRIEL